jgi:hypothetical protein
MKEQTNPSPELIAEWKQKYGEVYEFTSDDGRRCWLRRPTREILRAANKASGDDTIKWNEIIVENCLIAGDEAFKTNDRLFFGLSKTLTELVEAAKVELKKIC